LKKAFITGITGQDGSYLAELLLQKGYEVHGLVRREAIEDPKSRLWRIQNIINDLHIHYGALENYLSLINIFKKNQFDECYHLAAQSFVGHAIEDSTITLDTNIKGTLNLLSVLTEVNNKCRFYFAGSSEMFGNCGSTPQDESTPFNPRTIYGISKVSGYEIAKLFKNNYNMYVCCGILYNHESPRRANIYVTKKITNFVVDLKLGSHEKLSLGDISAKRDWGYAKDYVEAMWSIVQFASPESFVISSGELHSVEDICRIAFSYFGYNYKDFIMVKDALKRPKEKTILLGDSTKAKKLLGWSSSISFEDIINQMVEKEYHIRIANK
jgi:GDPmannose 4,6-dehydratase